MTNILTGVISIHSVHENVLDEIFNNGIDLDYENFVEENGEEAAEDYEADSPTIILGFKKNEEGLYDIDPEAEYSLIYNGGNCTVQIVHSRHMKTNCCFCSPCYPNQGDLDSNSGDVAAYCLDIDSISDDAPAVAKTGIIRIERKE